MSPSEEQSDKQLATVGEAAGLGLALAVVMALPSIVRSAGAGVPMIDGALAALAVTLTLALPLALLAPRAARGFRGVVGPSMPRAVTGGIVLWIALSLIALVILGALLAAKTHHRGLGGATFGVFGSAIVCAMAVVAMRLTGLGRLLAAKGVPRAALAGLVALAVSLALGALALPMIRGEPHPAQGTLFDLLLAAVAASLILPRRIPAPLARPARLVALPLALSLVAAGWYRIETSPTTASVQRLGGLPGTVLWALEMWTDRDGDGVGAHFGGRDCDEGDPRRHPGAKDDPEGGIDRDCDGRVGGAPFVITADMQKAEPARDPATVEAKAPPPEPDRLDLVLVTLDTTRADRTSLYGYERSTTPNLDKLAQRALVFEHAYAAGSDTQRALTPLVSGRPLSRTPHTAKDWPRIRDETLTLAERLQAVGYATGAVTGFTWLRKGRGFEQGFVHFDESPWRNSHPERDTTGAAGARAALEMYQKLSAGRAPLFLWLHLFDPHGDYLRHGDFDFGDKPSDRYDSEIAFTDAQLGKLLDAIAQSPRADHTLIVVHGSHGEAFGEHDKHEHGSDVYEEMIRVPLLIAVPGGRTGRFDRRAVSVSDITPTLLDFARAAADEVEGVSLRPALEGAPLERPPVLSFSDRRTAVIDWPLKLRVMRRSGKDRLLLFDLSADPGERKDLSAERRDDLARLDAERRGHQRE